MEKQSRLFIYFKIMKKYLYILLLIISFNNINGQEFPLHTQYMYNKGDINPGFVGVSGRISLLLLHRSQWIGVDGAPTTSNLSFEYPFEKAAIGVEFYRDAEGPVSKIMGKAQFAYNLELDYFTFLSLGIDVGVYNNKFDPNKLKIRDPETIFEKNYNSIDFDAGVGAFLYTEDWYIGVSVPNLNLQRKYKTNLNAIDKRLIHAYLMGGYNFDVSQRSIIQPSFMIRYANQLPISAEVSLNMKWNETLTTGLAYRFNSAYSLLIGFDVTRRLHIGYAFDWDQSRFHRTNFGSHEAFLRYYLSTEENSRRFQSPRFF